MNGPVEQFNQTMVLQAPAGVTEADVVVLLQALLDRHAMLRLRAEGHGGGEWSLTVPEAGAVDARACLDTLPVLSDEALAQARSQLDPAAGQWCARCGRRHRRAGARHSPSGRRRRVVADPGGGSQHRLGPASQWPSNIPADGRTSLAGGRPCWPSARTMRRSWNRQARGSR
ncbi:linear gramicidin synthetase subunit D domain protein [Mycobacterium xenopi 4042]|uniref:Linear gramicidin synthetase subunit D domain protein n=1 Tax=Mycobacterium xenopi 4042 TaxID=1299334 RepID=X8AGR8_MYCXE|nr:linear gramicidin synthetase subunit D domain protein [Mycobacterium xenopi 4042]